jgi:putative transposase
VRTTDSNHVLPIVPNLLEKHFIEAAAPRSSLGGGYHLCAHHRRTATTHCSQACARGGATKRPIQQDNRRLGADGSPADVIGAAAAVDGVQTRTLSQNALIQHSDHSIQCTSAEYRKVLEQFGIKASMSWRGNCYDNAPMVSFWVSLATVVQWVSLAHSLPIQ